MRVMWHVLGILVAVYAALLLLLYIFQEHLVFFPQTGRELLVTPAQAGMPYDDVRLNASDGTSLHGWYVPAPQARGTVLFFHGNAGNISHRMESVAMLHRLGYSTLIMDYRGYGDSSGKPGEQGTYEDAEAAWQYLTLQRHIPSCSIAVFGESLGGAIGAWLAARHKPAALVIASGFTSVPELAHHFYPYFPVRWLARIRYDTEEYIRNVAAPVLISHSPEDEIVPFNHGRALFASAHQPKRFLEIAGGHNDGFIFMRESWIKALGDFLEEHLRACAMQR